MSFKATSREIGGVTVIDMEGRSPLGEGGTAAGDLISEQLDAGHKEYRDEPGRNQLYRQQRDSGRW